MLTHEQVLRRPIALTEKAANLKLLNQVVFEVNRDANKAQIKQAVEALFTGVKVASVNTLIFRGKERRMGRGHAKLQNWKKAVVTLKAGNIDFFAENEAES